MAQLEAVTIYDFLGRDVAKLFPLFGGDSGDVACRCVKQYYSFTPAAKVAQRRAVLIVFRGGNWEGSGSNHHLGTPRRPIFMDFLWISMDFYGFLWILIDFDGISTLVDGCRLTSVTFFVTSVPKSKNYH